MTPAKKAPARNTTKKLAVKADEKPWTKKELDEVRGELLADRERLASELNLAEHELHDLMRDAGDGAGNDQADVGSTTFERDHEMSWPTTPADMLSQTEQGPRAHRGRHLRHLRELRSADRQDAVDGIPACDTVPAMQAARGASLNPATTRPPPAHPTGDGASVCCRCSPWWRRSATPPTWAPRSSPWRGSSPAPPYPLVGDWFGFYLTLNTGAAFSLGTSYTLVLTCVAIVAAVVGALDGRRLGSTGWALGLGFLLAGILGNLTDRIFRDPSPFRGHVVDFLQLPELPGLQRRRHLHQRRGGRYHPPGVARRCASTAAGSGREQ